MNEAEQDMKNFADLGGCYPPRQSASVDYALLDQHNSSYPAQPHSLIANSVSDPSIIVGSFPVSDDILDFVRTRNFFF